MAGRAVTPIEALAELMGKRYDSEAANEVRASKGGHHIPGTPYHYKHGWIPLTPIDVFLKNANKKKARPKGMRQPPRTREQLLTEALSSWKGDPQDMRIHSAHIISGEYCSNLEADAKAQALVEAVHASPKNPVPLYRGVHGKHIEVDTPEGWTTDRSVAKQFAGKDGEVITLPIGQAPALRVKDHFGGEPSREDEWIAFTPKSSIGPAKTIEVPAADTPEAKFAAARKSGMAAANEPEISGMQGSSSIIEFKDGSKYFRKFISGGWWPLSAKDMADREEAADLVARAVHARAPRIYRTGKDEIYADLVPGDTSIMHFEADIPQRVYGSPEARRIALLHILTGDVDVNLGNIMFDESDTPTSIDHTMAWFPNSTPPDIKAGKEGEILPGFHKTQSSFQSIVDPTDFTPSEKRRIDGELKAFKPEFERIFGRTDEYDQMMEWWAKFQSGRWGGLET